MIYSSKILKSMLIGGLLLSSTSAFSNTSMHGKRFQHWGGSCEATAQGQPVCYLEQLLRQNGHLILRAVIGYAPNQPYPTVFFELPPGIDIAAGVSLQVDNKKPIRFKGRCTRQVCSAGFALKPPMRKQFTKGQRAMVSYSPARGQQPVQIPVSLMGVTAGLRALR